VPTQATGVTYHVQYRLPVVGEPAQHGRARQPVQWTKCHVSFSHGGHFPDGHYFLYTDEGKVHQLRSVNGKWHCLAMAA
jgi:hypothetical protein